VNNSILRVYHASYFHITTVKPYGDAKHVEYLALTCEVKTTDFLLHPSDEGL